MTPQFHWSTLMGGPHMSISTKVKYLLGLWITEHAEDNTYIPSYEFTNFEVNIKDSKVLFTITCGKPGLIIGKSGMKMDAIEQFLSDHMHMPVTIILQESKIWD